MDNWYSVRAECAKDGCKVKDKPEGHNAYEGDVEPHQMMLVVLYGHTQHGGCGLNVEIDGESWP